MSINIIMVKKVLVIGCSITYGQELPARLKQSYPSLLSKSNDWEVVNRGFPGASNDRIIRILFEEIDNNYDLIIIAWTETSRKEVFDVRSDRFICINSNNYRSLDWVESYYKHSYDDFHNYENWLRQVILVESFFQSIKQDYIFCNTFSIIENYINKCPKLLSKIDTSKFVDWPNSIVEWTKDLPVGPNLHPLIEGHQVIANKINDHLSKRK
jgi:hypothetical protein